MANDLLEALYNYIGCDYISDLKISIYQHDIIKWLLSVDNHHYSLESWQYVVDYLFDIQDKFADVEKVKEFIKDYKA